MSMNLVGPHQRGPIGARFPMLTGAQNERRLWVAVLENAWDEARRDYDGVLVWIMSDSQRPGAFVWVCEALGLDPEAVRKAWPKGKPGTVRGARWRRG